MTLSWNATPRSWPDPASPTAPPGVRFYDPVRTGHRAEAKPKSVAEIKGGLLKAAGCVGTGEAVYYQVAAGDRQVPAYKDLTTLPAAFRPVRGKAPKCLAPGARG